MMTIYSQPGDYALTRSPIFFYVRDTNYENDGFYYVADVYIWSGAEVADKPAQPNIRLSRYPDATGGAAFDVGDVCNSLLDEHLVRENGAYFEHGTKYLFVEFGYVDSAGENLDEAHSSNIVIMKGWSYYPDGINLDVSEDETYSLNRWLTDRHERIRVFDGCYLTIGMTYKSTTYYGAHYVRIWDDADGDSVRYDLNALIGTADNSRERVLLFQCGYNTWLTDPTNLAAKVAFNSKIYPIREYYMQMENAGGAKIGKKWTFEIVHCAPWGFYTLQFLNRYGVWDYLICEGRTRRALEIETAEVFRNPLSITFGSGVSVDTAKGQYSVEVLGRESLTVNTGWLNETDNDLVRQMLMSKRVLCGESGGKIYQPLTVQMSSWQEQTQRGEKLISYELQLKYANDFINSVK